MDNQKHNFFPALVAIALVATGAFALLSSSDRLISQSQESDNAIVDDGSQLAAVIAASNTQCTKLSYGLLSSLNQAEISKFFAVILKMPESGLGWEIPIPATVTSPGHLAGSISRLKYLLGVIPEGQTYVGRYYFEKGLVDAINKVNCSPTPTIILANPYTAGRGVDSTGKLLQFDGTPLYQQRGLLPFRWNYYAIPDSTLVSLRIVKVSDRIADYNPSGTPPVIQDGEKYTVATDIKISDRLYEWSIPTDLPAGEYKAYIDCDGSTTCSDKANGTFIVRETKPFACGEILGARVDMSVYVATGRVNQQIGRMNDCSPHRQDLVGQACREYQAQSARLAEAMASFPESGYYNGRRSPINARGLNRPLLEVVKTFQTVHGIHAEGDPYYGIVDTATRRKIKELSCADSSTTAN